MWIRAISTNEKYWRKTTGFSTSQFFLTLEHLLINLARFFLQLWLASTSSSLWIGSALNTENWALATHWAWTNRENWASSLAEIIWAWSTSTILPRSFTRLPEQHRNMIFKKSNSLLEMKRFVLWQLAERYSIWWYFFLFEYVCTRLYFKNSEILGGVAWLATGRWNDGPRHLVQAWSKYNRLEFSRTRN